MSWIWGATPHAELSVESNRAHASDEAIARSLAADEDEQLAKSLQVSSATEAGARHAAEARDEAMARAMQRAEFRARILAPEHPSTTRSGARRAASVQRPLAPAARSSTSTWFWKLIMLVNAIMFVLTMRRNAYEFEPVRTNPLLGPPTTALIDVGAQTQELVLEGRQYWRMLSSMFLHAGLIHLGTNMAALYSLGRELEQRFGALRVALIYFASGLWGSALSAIFIADWVCVGASGAVFGLFGAVWADFAQNARRYRGRRRWMCVELLASTAVNVAISLLPLVNAFAHFGGFVCGMLLGLNLLVLKRYRRNRDGTREETGALWSQVVCAFVGGVAMMLLLLITLSIIVSGANPHEACAFCESLICFETPLWDCAQFACSTARPCQFGEVAPDTYWIYCTTDAIDDGTLPDSHNYTTRDEPGLCDCMDVCGTRH